MRCRPPLLTASALDTFASGIVSSSRPRRTLRPSWQSNTSSARQCTWVRQKKYPMAALSTRNAMALGSGFRHSSPSTADGAATKAINAAALSQTPRLNSLVFLKEMACMENRTRLENQLPLRIDAGWIVQIRAERYQHHGCIAGVAECVSHAGRYGQSQNLARRHADFANSA